ncbi:hypothetical protein NQ152_02345 [Microbacterium sp. zg.B48]|nr:hypothetical protein [Microbacterium sp. zg.B48]
MVNPAEFLRHAPIGTRVVVRSLLEDGGATDALGYLRSKDADAVVVETRRGRESVALAAVIAAKAVPPPPAPRVRRT